jgi:ribonuclease D
MNLITDTPSLEAFCDELARERFVTVDTEFMRDRTFWPRLCLVQLAGQDSAAAIDPLADGIDLKPLLGLMRDPAVLKVFHAARQDLEIFYRLMGDVPRPLYDTQVAAMVCGFGDEVAYETLVAKVAKARLDKSSRFTDWSRRPLSDQQLRYALSDVTYLRMIYERLSSRIEAAGRTEWVTAELEGLSKLDQYEMDPDQAWRRLKIRTRDPRFLGIVQGLARWRELAARQRDVPRNRIVRDDLLLEIAAHRPASVEQLKSHERISLDRESARQVVAVVQEALQLPSDALPRLPTPAETQRGLGPLVDLLRVLLKLRCEEEDVAQRLVATSADLEAIAQSDDADVPALTGWRREMFGDAALALKHGHTALGVRKGKPVLVAIDDAAGAAATAPAARPAPTPEPAR